MNRRTRTIPMFKKPRNITRYPDGTVFDHDILKDIKSEQELKIILNQYQNLRKHFNQLVDDVLGENYYNMGMDVYSCDAQCCEDLRDRLKGWRRHTDKSKVKICKKHLVKLIPLRNRRLFCPVCYSDSLKDFVENHQETKLMRGEYEHPGVSNTRKNSSL